MPDQMAAIEHALGDKFDPEGDYILARHSDRSNMLMKGYTQMGEVPDSTPNDGGTMIVFDRNVPAPKAKKGWF